MKLYEYQAKEIFAEAGIIVPVSVLIDSSKNNTDSLEAAVGYPLVLKSQLLQGGRGKSRINQAC